MFEHENFDVYPFEQLPLDTDCSLMEDAYLEAYEQALLRCFSGREYEQVGHVAFVAARKIHDAAAEMSWYPNISDRFHELTIYLPKDAFVTCVGSWRYDEKPHIFVKGDWLRALHLRRFAVFALVDAIGVKKALRQNTLSRERLLNLRDSIDELAAHHPDVSFISFADSLLLKGSWSVGHFQTSSTYTYGPEMFIRIVGELRAVYAATLDLGIYAVLTQGSNEYFDDSLLHHSPSQNHVSLNSLGFPFAELMAIDGAVHSHLHEHVHEPADLYLDDSFLHSLALKFDFDRAQLRRHVYQTRMRSGGGTYYCSSISTILDNLRAEPS